MLNRIDNVLTQDEIARIFEVFESVPFISGKATAKGGAQNVKDNLQLPPDNEQVQEIMKLVLDALKRNQEFFILAYPRRAYPPMFSRYEAGMTYGEHVDNSIMRMPKPMRTDVALTLFLSDPDSYDGGELVVKMTGGETAVKLPAGSLVTYPPYYVHRVEPVTRGVRYAAVTWAESLLRDPEQPAVMHQLDRAIRRLQENGQLPDDQTELTNVYHTLMRMWGEP